MSGVYIPDIKLPKDEPGAFQVIVMYVGADGKLRAECDGTHEVTIVPPHGKLIDADAVSLKDGPYEYDEWCEWALRQYQNAPTIIPADDPKLSATIKCGGAVTCTVAYSEEVYKKYVDTTGNLRWTGTHSGEHIIPLEEGE